MMTKEEKKHFCKYWVHYWETQLKLGENGVNNSDVQTLMERPCKSQAVLLKLYFTDVHIFMHLS